LRISGVPEKVEHAKRIIESLLAGDASTQPNLSQALRAANGPKSIGEVIVPRSSVGVIIGKGGDTIKRLAAETGAKIQFKPDGSFASIQDQQNYGIFSCQHYCFVFFWFNLFQMAIVCRSLISSFRTNIQLMRIWIFKAELYRIKKLRFTYIKSQLRAC